MLWLLGILILLAGTWFLLARKPPPPPILDASQSEPPDAFQTELVQAIATYEKDQLSCALRRMVVLEGHPDALLKPLEAKYGRCEGVPFLSLPGVWNPHTREGIQTWMMRNGMTFSEGAPAVQQLEQALEARIAQQARAILEGVVKGDGQATSG